MKQVSYILNIHSMYLELIENTKITC